MDIELLKRMMDAFYQAKRIRDMLPPLPEGVTSSYIQYLDVIHSLNCRGIQAKVSDISDALALPRPGVTRTIKDMETKGYVKSLHLLLMAASPIFPLQARVKNCTRNTMNSISMHWLPA